LPSDDLVGGVEAGGAGPRVHLEGEGEDAVGAPGPVGEGAVGDVEVAGLLRGVAVGGGHGSAHGGEGVVLVGVHAGGGVAVGVAVGPQDQLGVGVEVDGGAQLLDPADDPGVDEVPDPLGLGGREGRWSPVGGGRRAAAGPAAAAPPAAPVPV